MTSRVWVTGFGGFMGSHLVDLLERNGHQVLGTYFPPTAKVGRTAVRGKVGECDVRDRDKVRSLVEEFRPEKIYHLAAQSYPVVSWADPWYTLETNVIGTTNIFEAVKAVGVQCRILNACSSAEYGMVREDDVPVKEGRVLRPLHPYGVSKVSQELLAVQYFENFGIESVSVRIFNTTGPGKVNDVCSEFTKRLVEIEKGIDISGTLRVGNLDARRAITDVRDVIRAFDLALDLATPGEVYNLSGSTVYRIQEIVEMLRGMVDRDFEVKQDPALMRPTDEPIIFGDSTKFKKETGWREEIPLDVTLRDMLDYWRKAL
ncbi:GDP-mannose 4,6-dehydratase [Thioalkalicoccus limnaeus]|uniref:GDP-mannose 4,6-dehydratase n=1 Tax=Thioalkalicoccus limnaeus TaxID=120681 RepID=A0ABV4BJ34_9GAMM